MKVLAFNFRGQKYLVDLQGRINANDIGYFSEAWIFLGGSSHHWHTSIKVTRDAAFENPKLLNGCLGWDRDHGTIRRWGGLWNGRIPRMSNAHIEEI